MIVLPSSSASLLIFEDQAREKMAILTGAKRGLLNLPVDEEVGLVGLHWGDRFFEFVPQNGEVQWEVQPWGDWKVHFLNSLLASFGVPLLEASSALP